MVANRARLFTPALPPGVERKGRTVSGAAGGIIINALFPADLAEGLYRVAEKRGIKLSALMRELVTSNARLMREIEDTRPLVVELLISGEESNRHATKSRRRGGSAAATPR